MITRNFVVYGSSGAEQRASYEESHNYNWSRGDDIRVLSVFNYDKTGSHDYTVLCITRNEYKECKEELHGQISDGLFENYSHGKVIEIAVDDLRNYINTEPLKDYLLWKYL